MSHSAEVIRCSSTVHSDVLSYGFPNLRARLESHLQSVTYEERGLARPRWGVRRLWHLVCRAEWLCECMTVP